ncbi:50S ribosomal protein L31 [Candidatus Roizmanbacteria bacterium RIFCSPLOWO2_01_FULL_38_12]|uniref:Large ribosomal subunit protein bL31 n=1 Tax=Candidatus Roizmanbacteria bacterium RIFCSPLOWO2_01_FULL_38_12 TaxID=1802061 RepID=A0A1F7ITZ1_9BACT|nr:MAG: 50S ribosomal protein L31 [Candidatus Roizmanbacteria bacterium RIFCSPHIGHO2_01_FULL_38_15]OGK34850.1 MAG: 50S ribosomal protein L31 [Candidatus Roizmanbacteria bacterium RIFCSPHIGHO2_12_FULL_38_13]OGK46835.1 MAG: 50S ribosomal protein L31 [Candidatus Roizmanbacteria bacterium RIFCSPLOWO2_01_FULL_38_12]
MQASIHPKFYTDTIVTCACGNKFTTGSTKQSIAVDICSNCHPFFTGEHKFVDTKGTVDKFLKKAEAAKEYKKILSAKKKKKEGKEERSTKSLRELLGEI